MSPPPPYEYPSSLWPPRPPQTTQHSQQPPSMANTGYRPDGTLDPEYQRRIEQNNAPRSLSYQSPQYSYPYGNQYQPQHPQQQHPQQPYPHSYQQQQQQPYSQPYPNPLSSTNPYQPRHSYQPPPPQQQQYQQYPQPQPHPSPHSNSAYLPTPNDPHSIASGMGSSFRPSGRKRALLVGINYKGTSAELRGCVRDVTFIHHLLTSKFGFRNQDFVVLTDENCGITGVRTGSPTKKTIIDSLKWLINESRPGDSLWFSFSGHGSQIRDTNGDESDGYDETILPVNYKTAGHIVDDQLYEIVKRVCRGSRLTVLLDACHSGTGLDLPYQYDVHGTGSGQKISTGRPSSVASSIFNMAGAVLNGDANSASSAVLSMVSNLVKRKKHTPVAPDPNAGEVLLFSGCTDSQTSADTSKLTGGLSTGAMTYAFIETIEHSTVGDWRNYNYRTMLKTMREKLRAARMTQTPQFSTSHPFDVTTPFML